MVFSLQIKTINFTQSQLKRIEQKRTRLLLLIFLNFFNLDNIKFTISILIHSK